MQFALRLFINKCLPFQITNKLLITSGNIFFQFLTSHDTSLKEQCCFGSSIALLLRNPAFSCESVESCYCKHKLPVITAVSTLIQLFTAKVVLILMLNLIYCLEFEGFWRPCVTLRPIGFVTSFHCPVRKPSDSECYLSCRNCYMTSYVLKYTVILWSVTFLK
jgi:hypothetical protein